MFYGQVFISRWNGVLIPARSIGKCDTDMVLRLKYRREASGLTLKDLADRIGEKNYQTIQKIERGIRRLDLVRAKKLRSRFIVR